MPSGPSNPLEHRWGLQVKGAGPSDSPQSSHPGQGLTGPCTPGCTLCGLCLALSGVTGQAGVWTGEGMGWGLHRGSRGQIPFATRPVQPLASLLQLRQEVPAPGYSHKLCAWWFPCSLHSGLHVPYCRPQRKWGMPGTAQGPPQKKAESIPKLPSPKLSTKTPVI